MASGVICQNKIVLSRMALKECLNVLNFVYGRGFVKTKLEIAIGDTYCSLKGIVASEQRK